MTNNFLQQYDPWNQPGMVGYQAHLGSQGPEIFGSYGPEFGAAMVNLAAIRQLNPALLRQLPHAQLAHMPTDLSALVREQAGWNQRQQEQIDALMRELHAMRAGRPVLGTDMRMHERTGPVVPRELVIGVDSVGTIAAGATVNIPLAPQVTFRLERFIAADSTAASFDILDLRVGKDSQFVAAGAVPAEVFSNKSVGVGLKGDTATPGIQIIVTVANKTLAAARFQGAIIGLSVLNQ